MSQAEITQFLKEHNDRKWTSSEIAEAMKICLRNASVQLSKLTKEPKCLKEVESEKATQDIQKERGFKRFSPMCRLYFHISYKKGFQPIPFIEIKVGLISFEYKRTILF